jgi:formylglycine-generating enzyme required for sulfatase activity
VLDFSGIDDGKDGGGADATGVNGDGALPPGAEAGDDVLVPQPDAPFEASASPDAGPDSPVVTPDGAARDAGHDAAPGQDAQTDGPCPPLPGPAMVQVANFCIDSTEVTVTQYEAFLAAKNGDTSGQPAQCSVWNTTLVPFNTWPPNGSADQPVSSVNWCQAYMYCQWAGKRLCGNPAGGAADPNKWNDATQSAWFKACSHNNDGLHTYPYGLTYDPKRCNGVDYEAGAPLPGLPSCAGPYPGLQDMSGNVFEWEDSCEPATTDSGAPPGYTDFCHTRGGSYQEDAVNLECAESYSYTRASVAPFIGIRCCSL